jgi:predicted ATPase
LCALADEAIQLSTEYDFPTWKGWGCLLRGWAGAHLSEGREGVAQALEAIALLASTNTQVGAPGVMLCVAEAQRVSGLEDDALASVKGALMIVEDRDERAFEGELNRLEGELLVESGDLVGAERCFREALAIARAREMNSFELRASMSLSRLHLDRGRKREGGVLLEAIYGKFREGFETPDSREARELLLALS